MLVREEKFKSGCIQGKDALGGFAPHTELADVGI